MKLRVALCASALSLALPAAASAAIDLTSPLLRTNTPPHLDWTQDDGVGPYDVLRGSPTCAAPATVGSVPAVANPLDPVAFDDNDSLTDGVYCYRVVDTALSQASTSDVLITVDTVTATPNISAPSNGSTEHGPITITFSNTDASTPVS